MLKIAYKLEADRRSELILNFSIFQRGNDRVCVEMRQEGAGRASDAESPVHRSVLHEIRRCG